MDKPCKTRGVLAALALWFAVAAGLGISGVVATWRPPIPQVVLFGLVGFLFVASWLGKDFGCGSARSR